MRGHPVTDHTNTRGMSINKATARAQPPASELLSIIFHELRIPLSSIQGYSSILLSGELGALSQRQRDTVERLRDITHHVTALMTNLTQWAHLSDDPSMLTWQPVDVEKLVRSICHDLNVEAKRKGVHLVAHLPQPIGPLWADRSSLTEVLINLIVNAIKFTAKGGKVTVSVGETKGKVHLTVTDTGVGIRAETIPKLFQSFYHEDNPEVGAVGGTGLGLAIVKRIVENHHGTVSVSSRLGQGSIFRVVLPRHSGQEVVQDIIDQLSERAGQRRESFVLMLIEADGTNGASAKSTEALYHRVEQLIQETIRMEDRYYPVEKGKLIAVLVRTHADGGRAIAERFTQRFQKDTLLRRTTTFHVKMGLAAYPTHGHHAPQLLKAARERMTSLVNGAKAH